MAAVILDGRKVAAAMIDECRARSSRFLGKAGRLPCLAAILVGPNELARSQAVIKRKRGAEAGVEVRVVELPVTTTAEGLAEAIQALNADTAVDGIFLHLPLPAEMFEDDAGYSERDLIDHVDWTKDVDGVTWRNLGQQMTGLPRFRCGTAWGVMLLMRSEWVPIDFKTHALVIDTSDTFGLPMSLMLLERGAVVTVARASSPSLPELVKQSDIVVSAAGEPGLIRAAWIKPGAAVIDASYAGGRGGDVEPAVAEVAGYLAPVPGGVGPMTVAVLLEQTIEAAEAASETR
jgi:methylenetetrahydrofolate dehydrogenase (NADP+) / methenyltetrahydrofolate cyclohydrolase